MSERKVIVIGLDGATWNLIKPWADSGELPTFKKLMTKGVWGILESPFPVTVPSWACYSTGKNPGKFGVFDWIKIDLNKRKIKTVNYKDFKSKEIWDYLNEYGVKTGIINIPHTYPPKKVDGFMISGMLASEISNYTYPKSLKKELEEIGYKIHPQFPLHLITKDKQKYVNEVKQLVKLRFKVAREKLDEVEFLHLTIFYIDYLQHFLWDSLEVLSVWKIIDKELGEFLRELKSKNIKFTLILMSDHGFTQLKSRLGFYLNAFLMKKRLLRVKKFYFYQILYKCGIRFEVLSDIAKKLRLYEFGRKYLRKLARRLPTQDGEIVHEGLESIIDWDNSKLINMGGIIGQIYILDKNNHEQFISELKKDLLNLRDPITYEKVISKVVPKEKIISGKFLSEAPDFFVYPNEGYVIGRFNIYGDIFQKSIWTATHTKNGIFLLYGDGIKYPNSIINSFTFRASIYDLAPTILSLFNVPIPEDMDGKILMEFLRDEVTKEVSREQTFHKEKERIRRIVKVKFKGGKTNNE